MNRLGNWKDRRRSAHADDRPRSIYPSQYFDMALGFSGETSIFGAVFLVSKSLLGIEGLKELCNIAILS